MEYSLGMNEFPTNSGAATAPVTANAVRHLRASARLAALAIATFVIYGTYLVGEIMLRAGSKAAARSWRYWIFRTWARTFARIAGMRLTVEGTAPAAPFLLVSNHLSYFDIIAYSCVVGCTYVAKSDLASWPVVGRLCKSMHVIFIDRTRRADVVRVGSLVEQAVNEGEGVIIFPEGTSTMGAAVDPFKPSLLEYPARVSLPVWNAAITYATPEGEMPAHLAVCWWGDMTFGSHFYELFQLPGFSATIRFGAGTVVEPDRKLLAERLHAAVSSEFVPVARSTHG